MASIWEEMGPEPFLASDSMFMTFFLYLEPSVWHPGVMFTTNKKKVLSVSQRRLHRRVAMMHID